MTPAETASPQQYLRLLLMRLLETQQCIAPKLHEPSLAFLRFQYQTNAYTLSEIKSWLEAVGDNSPLGPSPVSARPAATSGHESHPLVSRPADGPPISPFAIVARPPASTPPPAPLSPAASSSPSPSTLPANALISNGSVTFQLR